MTRTKIICTIGPACNSVEMMVELIKAGMNVARLNFSHGTHELHKVSIDNLKEARRLTGKPLAIMLDTKGPEIRLGKVKDGQLPVEAGDRINLVREEVEGTLEALTLTPAVTFDAMKSGMKILFDDGYISSHVAEILPEKVIVEIENRGVLKSNKGVNIPNQEIDLPAMTERDIEDIRFGCLHDVDLIAASFVRSADHVLAIKRLLAKEGKPEILVVAKIENFQGVDNFDTIVQIADGIMIARGDLGVELPLSQVPRLQKMMIRKSCLAGKPSVTATQMLESMIVNPRPTRAEVSDVANAIYDSTSSVMLSGETAVGKYPVQVVQVMRSVVQEAELDFKYREFFYHDFQRVYHDVPSSVTLATVKTAYSASAKAIFAYSSSGLTARLLSRLRPEMPIIAMTPNKKIFNQLAFYWGVIPFLCENAGSIEEAFAKGSRFALEKGYAGYGDLVVVTGGTPFGIAGTTNMMMVESIGDVLVRGYQGHGKPVFGKVALVLSPEVRKLENVKGHILVIPKCDEAFLPILKLAAGIILQNNIDDIDSEKYALSFAKKFDLPVIVRADSASILLKEGQLVTLDPEKAIVFKGKIEEGI